MGRLARARSSRIATLVREGAIGRSSSCWCGKSLVCPMGMAGPDQFSDLHSEM
jgi:hypothetical protein